MKSQCSVFIMKSVVCAQFIAESIVNLDKINTNKGIVLHKKFRPFLYIIKLINIKGKNKNIVIYDDLCIII